MLCHLRRRKLKHFPTGLVELADPTDSIIDIVFIHEITEPRNEAWRSTKTDGTWIKEVLQGSHADIKARILAFGYDASDVRKLGELLSPDLVTKCAKELLYWYPLRREPYKATQSSQSEMSGGANVKQPKHATSSHNRQSTMDGRRVDRPVDINRPTIFVGHGFGGLIYEQALTLTYESDLDTSEEAESFARSEEAVRMCYQKKPKHLAKEDDRNHGALLFNTPHDRQGFGEWAVLCARSANIPSPKTVVGADWTPYRESIQRLDNMQRRFRRVIREVNAVSLWAFFGPDALPGSKLSLPQELSVIPDAWAVQPGRNNHFTLTQSAVDENHDEVYLPWENNTYRSTCMAVCQWAEESLEGSSECGRLVLDSIQTTRSLLRVLVSCDSSDDPEITRIAYNGEHVLAILEILQDEPRMRSMISQLHSRNSYKRENGTLRVALVGLQRDIDDATKILETTDRKLEIAFDAGSLHKFDEGLRKIRAYIVWASKDGKWGEPVADDSLDNGYKTPAPPVLLRRHLRAFPHGRPLDTVFEGLTVSGMSIQTERSPSPNRRASQSKG